MSRWRFAGSEALFFFSSVSHTHTHTCGRAVGVHTHVSRCGVCHLPIKPRGPASGVCGESLELQ